MALIHAASITPTKHEAIAAWLPTQPWAPPTGGLRLLAAYRFDDPEGKVGLETHLVGCGDVVVQVPLTYRDAPRRDAEPSLVCTMEHSALGERWVYDGAADPAYLRMLAATTLTGVGQAVELRVTEDGAWTRSPQVRLSGRGSVEGTVRVDGWGAGEQDGDDTVFRSADLELRLARFPRPVFTCRAALLGTWTGQEEPAVLATVAQHGVQARE